MARIKSFSIWRKRKLFTLTKFCANILPMEKRLLNNKNMAKTIKEYALMTFGCFLAAVSLFTYIVPNKFVAGGVSGIASLLEIIGIAKAWIAMLIFNAPLLLLAVVYLNKQFAIRTVYCTILISLIMKIMEEITFPVFVDDRLLAAIYSGILYGVGMAMFFEANSSSAGSEIIARLVILKKPNYNIAFVLFVMDAVVMLASWVVCDFWSVAYAIICAVCSAKTMDIYLRGIDLPVVYYIITDKADKIKTLLEDFLQSGATKFDAKGNDNISNKEVVTVVVKSRQTKRFKQLLKECDSEAFAYSIVTKSVLRRSYNKRES